MTAFQSQGVMKYVAAAALVAAHLALVAPASAMAKAQKADVPADCLTMDLTPYSTSQPLDIQAYKGKAHFNVEIADTYEKREQGLMCRANLKNDYGMLFEFDQAKEQTFWMKDTVSGLDIIYIAPDGRIVSIQKYAKPLDRTPLPSYGEASGVLEIKAGLSDRLGLKPGDRVIHPFFHKP